ncbi:MAG: hypothetical protein K0R43_428 [Pseudoduganella sp.]|jgi:flagellar basal-body rod protein FlgB|nr:hypothetical protein [Pseudoduganella sp.]
MTRPNHDMTVGLVRLALDAASLRQQASANNIANAASPGYRPLRVSFEDQLAQVQATLQAGQLAGAAQWAGAAPVLLPAADAGSVALDLESAQLAQTSLQYQSLLKALSKHFSIISTAINQGKR